MYFLTLIQVYLHDLRGRSEAEWEWRERLAHMRWCRAMEDLRRE